MSISLMIKNRSAKKILNNSGLNIETCVTPNTIQIFSIFIVFYLASSNVLDVMQEY